MKRWTIKELNQISDLELARRILMERQRDCRIILRSTKNYSLLLNG